ncbi:hypothetical protein J421_0986 [Gemmatirosa kalamazoonensis]|uniref:Uncharacterized protein n=1 Tax=Gemmatirosa kalamazoonensis TaxID=861299 RepID=W0RGI9_9BACT|nr:hypothetical protein [Gemmatirosa kalamazoonensis]AHG88523.1 hypothetical protein J421_0986 [Gemmatirosa kalamazoonensis]
MPTTAHIWNDPRYRHFFRRAAQTIAHARQLQLQPWLGEREERFHRVILEICGAEVDELAGAH